MTHATGIVAQLRALRLERGLPLKCIAHDLGISRWWLCRLEHDRKGTFEQIERWAAALGAEVVIVAIATKTIARKKRAA